MVLSGLDENGSAALEAFKSRGGVIIAQAPETAECPEMPQAAIRTGVVDYVLLPEAIAAQLEKTAEDLRESQSVP